jgi:hypothetical protein
VLNIHDENQDFEIFSMTWQPGMVGFTGLPLAPSPSHQHFGIAMVQNAIPSH